MNFDNIKNKGKCNHQTNENNIEKLFINKRLIIHKAYSDEKIGIYEIEEQENNNNGDGYFQDEYKMNEKTFLFHQILLKGTPHTTQNEFRYRGSLKKPYGV